MENRPDIDWMTTDQGAFIDIHDTLRKHEEVISFLRRLEQEFSIKEYCNGANAGGRWIYQFYSIEFIQDLSRIVNSLCEASDGSGIVLEVMAGDGLLSSYLAQDIALQTKPTDNKGSRDNIEFPKSMETIDALEAVRKYKPAIILLCWEPFYSDISVSIARTGTPLIWIGDPNSCAVSSAIHEVDYQQKHSDFLLGRHDSVIMQDFRTEMRIYNPP